MGIKILDFRRFEYDNLLDNVRKILEPVQEEGFEILSCQIKPQEVRSKDIAVTGVDRLEIKLEKDEQQIDLSLQIPMLIDNNYIIIADNRKIPLFQLFDFPVIAGPGVNIKIRTNVATLSLTRKRNYPTYQLGFNGKFIPFVYVLLARENGYQRTLDVLEIEDLNEAVRESSPVRGRIKDLLSELYLEWEANQDRKYYFKEIGKIFTRYNQTAKGENISYALDLISKVDYISKDLMKTDNCIDEMLVTLRDGSFNDLDFKYKRLRCVEYMILRKVMENVYQLLVTTKNAKKIAFRIESSSIMKECNQSNIVQFDQSINPLEQLTMLTRCTLVGPGGFDGDHVPAKLRDINDTMFGRLCPVDTPDRDRCGVLHNVLNVELDKYGRFETTEEKDTFSPSIGMVPFLEHNDQTRLQMAASQMRQAVQLERFDVPLIKSGLEGRNIDYTTFIHRAKRDGEVIYRDSKILIVVYDDNTTDAFDISYKRTWMDNLDFMDVNVDVGDRFRAGDILAESNFLKNGELTIGRNLLTGIMTYYGLNYEDGIVISDRLVKEGVLTSCHLLDMSFNLPPNKILLPLSKDRLKLLPYKYETIPLGKPYARIRNAAQNEIYNSIWFKQEKELLASKSVLITEVNVYANKWNKDVAQFSHWVEKTIEKQIEDEKHLRDVLESALGKERAKRFIKERNLAKFDNVGNFRYKGNKIEGIRVEMYGYYSKPIIEGDKLGNRHGNKGVISAIVEQDKMPRLPDGRPLDILLSPLGVVSRMNIGQLYELHVSMALENVKNKMKEMLREGKDQQEIKDFFLGFLSIADKAEDRRYFKRQKEEFDKVDLNEDYIDSLRLVQYPFCSVSEKEVVELMNYAQTPFEFEIYDPISKQKLKNKVACGYMYIIKLVQMADEKLSARCVGPYAPKVLQPTSGKKQKGGQRLGEMEVWAMIAHEGLKNLNECLTTKSDCTYLKNKYLVDILDSKAQKPLEEDYQSESVKLLNIYLKSLGLDFRPRQTKEGENVKEQRSKPEGEKEAKD